MNVSGGKLLLITLLAFLLGIFLLHKLHHALLAIDLPVRKLVFLACKGILAGTKLKPNGRADHIQMFAKGLFQIAFIARRHFVRLIAVNDDNGRIVATRVGIAELDSPPVYHGRSMIEYRTFENIV